MTLKFDINGIRKGQKGIRKERARGLEAERAGGDSLLSAKGPWESHFI
jgi:hypothetical protein